MLRHDIHFWPPSDGQEGRCETEIAKRTVLITRIPTLSIHLGHGPYKTLLPHESGDKDQRGGVHLGDDGGRGGRVRRAVLGGGCRGHGLHDGRRLAQDGKAEEEMGGRVEDDNAMEAFLDKLLAEMNFFPSFLHDNRGGCPNLL